MAIGQRRRSCRVTRSRFRAIEDGAGCHLRPRRRYAVRRTGVGQRAQRTMRRGGMRRWSYAAMTVLLAASLLPIASAHAQDTGRVKASQLLKSVVLINTFACESQPVPGQKVPVPFQDLQ